MKISIIIPSYNTGKYIRQAINSVLSQAYPDVECIVVDGGSNDDTLRILKSYGNFIKWVSEPDKGEPDAINKGMKMATGDVIGYLDADDIYLEDALTSVAVKFHIYKNLMWLYGKGHIINESGEECRTFITKFKELFQCRYSYSKLLCVDFICQPTAFWRRELLEEIGGFPTDEKLAFEYDFWLRAGAKYKPAFINEYLASWRSHNESESAKDIYKDMRDALRLSRKYSKGRWLLNIIQVGVYCMTVCGYFMIGILKERR